MRILTLVVASTLLAVPLSAQHNHDQGDAVKDGGIKVAGWKGRVDRRPASQGRTIADSRFDREGDSFRINVGPAGNFWNDSHTASGNYEVKATFREHAMSEAHPHSYGIFIGGADLESDSETLLYCIAYGNGTYSVKTFHGENVITLVDRAESPALRKAGSGGEVVNEIGWRVEDGKASCVFNGTVARSFDRNEVIAADKIKSLDGVYGFRVGQNLDLTVSEIKLTR